MDAVIGGTVRLITDIQELGYKGEVLNVMNVFDGAVEVSRTNSKRDSFCILHTEYETDNSIQ